MVPRSMVARSWRPGSRVARLRGSHSYRSVLFLTLAIFVFIMAAPDGAWSLGLIGLLLCTSLIVAIWTAGFGWSLPRTLIVGAVGVAAVLVPNTVSGGVHYNNNTLVDTDGNELVSNTISGGLQCAGNVPAPQPGDSGGTPNTVTGGKKGQCTAV